ncbi:MAG TPA: nucleoside triphosphate pyrophosphatase [Gemmataceae bacterium]|nr:nucleoside triphosphate pyrophosphatase [Gemmataceae bacterium]
MADPLPLRLILASGSPARRELLDRAGYRFEVMPADIEEPSGAGIQDIRAFVQSVAWLKAAAVAPRVSDGVVLAADTVGWVDGQVLGKPADEADARRILKLLGDREHELWTGVVLWRRPDDVQLAWQERSRVFFRSLSDAELDVYLATRQWRENSGAYAIQEPVDPYVRVVEGSVSNVVGLPLETLIPLLRWFTATR